VAELRDSRALSELRGMKVSSISLAGNRELARALVMARISTRVGDPLEPSALRRDLRAILRLNGIADARVGAIRAKAGVGLVFVVAEAPRIASVEVAGGKALSKRELLALAGVSNGAYFDPVKAREAVAAMRERYVALGRWGTRITWSTRKVGERVALTFQVVESAPVRIVSVTFPGASAVPAEILLQRFATSGAANNVGSPYIGEEAEKGILLVTNEYYERGYIEVRVGQLRVLERSPTEIALELPIVEGQQFRFGTVKVTGKLAAPLASYQHLIQSRRGQVFQRSAINADITRISEFHRGLGRNNDEITPQARVDHDKLTVDIDLVIAPR
jgi:outer membrane protein insertion porin family